MDISSYKAYTKPTTSTFKMYENRSFIKQLKVADIDYVYKPILGISKSAPVKVACQDHKIPDGWSIQISGVRGMKELDQDNFYPIKALTKDLVEINSINSTQYSEYTGGGTIKYLKPFDLTSFIPKLTLIDSSGTDIHLSGLDIVNLNLDTNTVDIVLTPETVSRSTATKYRLDLYSKNIVLPIFSGSIIKAKD